MTGDQIAFALFWILSQAMLSAFFGARRWVPGIAARLACTFNPFAGLGLPLGLWLFVDGQSWRLFFGPLLMAVWALLGAAVDLWRPINWRRPPFTWAVLVPYLLLYFFAQMFLWWPLLNIQFAAWAVFLVLFFPSTVLNFPGHVNVGSQPDRRARPTAGPGRRG